MGVAGLLKQAILVHEALAVREPGEEEDMVQVQQRETSRDAFRLGRKYRHPILRVHRLQCHGSVTQTFCVRSRKLLKLPSANQTWMRPSHLQTFHLTPTGAAADGHAHCGFGTFGHSARMQRELRAGCPYNLCIVVCTLADTHVWHLIIQQQDMWERRARPRFSHVLLDAQMPQHVHKWTHQDAGEVCLMPAVRRAAES